MNYVLLLFDKSAIKILFQVLMLLLKFDLGLSSLTQASVLFIMQVYICDLHFVELILKISL